LILETALGGRINELACLPVDCLQQVEGKWVLKVYPQKGAELILRPFPQDLVPVVTEAVAYMCSITEAGRQIVRNLRHQPQVDWLKVKSSTEALTYYTRKFSYEWRKLFSLYTHSSVFFKQAGLFVDAIGLERRLGSNKAAAVYLGTNVNIFKKLVVRQESLRNGVYLFGTERRELKQLHTHSPNFNTVLRGNSPHALSIKNMEGFYQVHLFYASKVVSTVLDDELRRQFLDLPSGFEFDPAFEEKYGMTIQPVIRRGSLSILEPEDALCVIPFGLFTKNFVVRTNRYQLVSSSMFSRWLAEARSTEDSLFSKHKIIDPRTGDVAQLTWHDLRHWLNTIYKQGGLTDLQVNTILGRKNLYQARVYDQTPSTDRATALDEMMGAIRRGGALGKIPDTYNSISLDNRALAEEYLHAAVRLLNPMPHGGCALNLALKPCPHSLSCLTVNDTGEPCNHLLVDIHDESQFKELSIISQNSKEIRNHIEEMGGEGGKQYQHFIRVEQSVLRLIELRKLRLKEEKGS
jgi:hypothetical protein